MLPHEVITSKLIAPKFATLLKIGLQFTSLTWRGRGAWAIHDSPFYRLGGPIMGFLIGRDVEVRTKIEWSDDTSWTLKPYSNGVSKGSDHSFVHFMGLRGG